MLQMTSLNHCMIDSRREMAYHSRIVIVNTSHLQNKVKINKEGIMVMVFLILFFIIKSIIM
jgi:hypothetical protein